MSGTTASPGGEPPGVWEKEVRPPSSPDCNPLDFVWGVSESKVNAKPHNKIEDLFQKMKALVVGSLDRTPWQKPASIE